MSSKPDQHHEINLVLLLVSATTRLKNQRMLIGTEYLGLWKDREVKSGIVELMKFPLIARLVI